MSEDRIVIGKECVKPLYDAKFVHLFDYRYAEGRHYFVASRNSEDDLVAVKSDDEFRAMFPDAVTVAVILRLPGEEPKLLLQYEYRYATGRFLLSPVAGLLDAADREAACRTRDMNTVDTSDRSEVDREGAQTAPDSTGDCDFAAERIKAAVFTAAAREVHEETGLTVKPSDKMSLITPLAFCTPGLTDESNAFAAVEITLDDSSALNHKGAEGTELFSDFLLITRDEARRIMAEGRDPKGNFFSVATWFVLGYFGYVL